MAVIDAIGKPPAGVALGGFQWLGSYDECQHISNMTKEFSGKYCVSTYTAPNVFPKQQLDVDQLTLEWGICVSQKCSTEDARSFFLTVLSLLPTDQIKLDTVVCQPDMFDLNFSPLAIVSILTFGVVLIVTGVGTTYDLLRRRDRKRRQALEEGSSSPNRRTELPDHSRAMANGSIVSVNGTAAPEEDRDTIGVGDVRDELLPENGTRREKGRLSDYLLAFSFVTNTEKLLDPKTSHGHLTCLDGLKFISMTWVILGHNYFFVISDGLASNMVLLQTMLNRWTFLTVLNASLSADTFFLLSGCLVSYVTLRRLKTRGVNWVLFYLRRYVRLTPTFALLVIVYVGLLQIWSDGPVYPRKDFGFDPNCRTNWWTNLLYVNNLVHSDRQCIGWTWYLACEMQFYVISPIVILLFYHCHWWLGSTACFALVLVHCLTTGLEARNQNLDMTYKSLFSNQDIYWKPWCRVGVYALGLLLGYVLQKQLDDPESKPRIDKKLGTLGWLLAVVCCYTALQGPFESYHGNPPSYDVAAAYLAVFRVLWGAGVAWVVYACATGNGGFVNDFLSWKVFLPLSRLSYSAYLIHPVTMQIYLLSLRTTIYVNDFTIGYLWLAHLVTAFAVGYMLHVLFEAPSLRLVKALITRKD